MQEKNNRLKEIFDNQSSYCYDGTDVLKNKLNITDRLELEKAERALTLLRLTHLQMYGLDMTFSFNIKYYLEIHRFVFQDLYDFAGITRNENITKGNTPFCRPEYIYKSLEFILKEMHGKISKLNSKEEIIDYLAYYYSEINIVHPFREGNGRILREFLRQVVNYINKLNNTNYDLDYSNVTDEDRNNLIKGSIISSYNGDITLLKIFFNNMLKEEVKKL